MVGRGRGSFRLAVLLVLAAQASVLVFFFQPRGAAADFLSPLISPFKNASCAIAQCGKGTCKPSDDSSSSNNTSFLGLLGVGFTCECDPGWKRLYDGNNTFGFLPCVLPNCTISSSCSAEAPAPPPPPPSSSMNLSNWAIFDPCALSACGEGTCVKTSSLAYRCDCREGTRNLLNQTNFPCLRDCALGADCSQLQLGFPKPTSPTSSSTATSASPPGPATKGSQMIIMWLSVLMMMLVASIP